MSGISLSVAFITFNEERNIARSLGAVRDIASQIVVVDSGSTDRTVQIAREFGAEVYIKEWKGYSEQRNSALEKCTGDWVLFLDADEVVSDPLKESILRELRNPSGDGYYVNRKTYYLGKFLNHAWQPEWRLRLVRRDLEPRWEGDIHERLIINSKRLAYLKGDLYHYSFESLKDHIDKAVKMARASAKELQKRDRSLHPGDLTIRPLWSFLKIFILQRGFLDGYRGLLVASISSFSTFLKYAFLYELKIKNQKGLE